MAPRDGTEVQFVSISFNQNCLLAHGSKAIITFAEDTTVVGLISNQSSWVSICPMTLPGPSAPPLWLRESLIPEEAEESSTVCSNSGELLLLYHQTHTSKIHFSATLWLVKTHDWCLATLHQGHSCNCCLKRVRGIIMEIIIDSYHKYGLFASIWEGLQEPPWFHHGFLFSAANLLISTQWC